MIAITSHRNHMDREYARNQKAAFLSWMPHFSNIFSFGPVEKELDFGKTFFIQSVNFPKIRDLVEAASKCNTDYVTILNSDIILSQSFSMVPKKMEGFKAPAAISRRWTIPDTTTFKGKLTDWGIDIFVATPSAWKTVLPVIPKEFRIGHIRWDTWMLGFFNARFPKKVCDFTDLRCVFHPTHGNRSTPYNEEISLVKDRYLANASMPGRKIK
jgi:hypothetical protein